MDCFPMLYIALYVFVTAATTNGFVVMPTTTPRWFAYSSTLTQTCSLAAKGEEEEEETFSSSEKDDLWESLRARQVQLETRKYEMDQKWKNADCESGPRVSLPDWVRRLDVSDYPIAACGSASGTIFVANLETGQIVAQSTPTNDMDDDDDAKEHPVDVTDKETLRLLYGGYDGGGTLAIAMHRNLICSAGRQGGVQIWRHDDTSPLLISQGNLQALEGKNVMVTSLKLTHDLLWVVDSKGQVKAFSHSSSNVPLALQREPVYTYNFDSTITSLSLLPEESIGVVATALGSVEVFSFEEETPNKNNNSLNILASWSPPFRRGVFAQCAAILPRWNSGSGEDGYSIVCGGSDGTLHIQSLSWDYDASSLVDKKKPFLNDADQCRPSHLAAVKCIACPSPEVMVTGGQDGSLRVWDLSVSSKGDGPNCLYQFIGYKVWLGSLWTDGIRLVSDGSDNTVIVHDFEKEADSTEL